MSELSDRAGKWRRTLEAARMLRSRVILFQCPARFGFGPTPENKSNLRAFFCEVGRYGGTGSNARKFTFVWEPWGEWKPEEVRELCQELGLVHGVDPFMKKLTTNGLGYFRLHGRGGYRYRHTDDDLEELLATAKVRKSCYVLFNKIAMLEDARHFLKLASTTGRASMDDPD